MYTFRSFAAAALFLTGAATASAQFQPANSATISTPVTTAQTLGSGTGTITSTGSITLSSTGAVLTMSGTGTTLLNYGTVSNTNTASSGSARGIVADGTNIQITNEVGAFIQTAGNDAVRSSSSGTSITLNNYGTITASNTSTTNPQQAVDWNSITTGANTLNNYGMITATGNDAVRPGVNGAVNNYVGGTMMSANNASGTSSDGIDAQTNTGVVVTNGIAVAGSSSTAALIEGGRHGITGGNTTGTGAYTMSITNNMGGTIQGDNGSGVNIDGINGNELVTIINNGTITGNVTTLNTGETSHDGDGVDVDGLVNLTNNGTIKSLNAIGDTSEGVTVGGGTIVNNVGALIEGDIASGNTSVATGKGITVLGIDSVNPIAAMYGNTIINNSGTIRGQTTSGITVGVSNNGVSVTASGFTTTITNNAGGLIEGAGATAPAIQTGPDNDTVNDAGTIKADASGIAIDLGGGNNAVNITGGAASIQGDVSGGAGGTNSLTITPGTGNAFSYTGNFSNFATAQIGAGRVTLAGASTYAGTTTVLNGGTLVANTLASAGSATGSGTVSIQQGGILAGTGNVAGAVTLATGAKLSPGDNSVSTLSLGSDLNTVGGSSFSYDIGSSDLSSDHLTLAGTLYFTGSGQLIFNVASNGITTGTFDLIHFAGSSGLTTANLGFGSVPTGFQGSFTLNGNDLLLNVSAVPEPKATLLLALAGVTAFVIYRRRSGA